MGNPQSSQSSHYARNSNRGAGHWYHQPVSVCPAYIPVLEVSYYVQQTSSHSTSLIADTKEVSKYVTTHHVHGKDKCGENQCFVETCWPEGWHSARQCILQTWGRKVSYIITYGPLEEAITSNVQRQSKIKLGNAEAMLYLNPFWYCPCNPLPLQLVYVASHTIGKCYSLGSLKLWVCASDIPFNQCT